MLTPYFNLLKIFQIKKQSIYINVNRLFLFAWRRPTLAEAKPRLPSALESLTTVFEMGTGVTSPL